MRPRHRKSRSSGSNSVERAPESRPRRGSFRLERVRIDRDGEKIDIRSLEKSDVPEMVAYLRHPNLLGLTGIDGDRGTALSNDRIEEGVEKWRVDGTSATYVLDQDDSVAGHLRMGWWWDALTPWIAVVVAPNRRNRGLGGEAARWSLRHLFTNSPAHVVHASTPDWNGEGIRFAERLGFERAGAMRRTGIRDGRYTATIEFELLRTRWDERRADGR